MLEYRGLPSSREYQGIGVLVHLPGQEVKWKTITFTDDWPVRPVDVVSRCPYANLFADQGDNYDNL
jgi:hypothetical protein